MINNSLDNPSLAAINFSLAYGYKPKLDFLNQIQQHPFYPSLWSISEVLEKEAGIKNLALKLKPEQLKEVNFPCIAHLNTNGGEYAFLKDVDDENVYYDLNGKKRKLTLQEFVKTWSGVVLLSEHEKSILKRKLGIENISQYILPALSLMILALVFWNSLQASVINAVGFTSQFIVLFSGLVVSILLLLQSLGKSNSLIQQICGGDAKHNCNHILSAKAANVNNWLSLSDLGFLYFSGSLLLLFLSNNGTALILLVFLNILTLPFTFWSVYYQWRVAKTWCRLCLMVQALFWLQAISSFFLLQSAPIFYGIDLPRILILGLIYVFPLTLWLSVKPIFKNTQAISPLKQELNRLKFNVAIFKNLLQNQKQYVGELPKTTIVMGNPHSSLEITMVSNPFCNPCAKAHQFLEKWISKGVDFRLNIVYTFEMDENDLQNHFFTHLMAIKNGNGSVLEEALKDWYSEDYQKLDKWKEKYPAQTSESDKLELLAQVNWCRLNEIKGTPTFYINGFQLPDSYNLKDLKYLLMNLDN